MSPMAWPGAGRPDGRTRSKYHAQRCWHDDHWHDSLKERARCFVLVTELAQGAIERLERQPRYRLTVNGVKIADYVADFTYVRQGQRIVEDVKSPATRTPVYRLKQRLLSALYNINILET